MMQKSPIRLRNVLILALLIASVPLHIAVKKMIWSEDLKLVPLGQQAPSFRLYDEKGQLRSLSDSKGKMVLLNFCTVEEPACHNQAAYLNKFVERYAHNGLEVFMLADGATAAQVKKFNNMVKAEFNILRDNGGNIAQRYGVMRFPSNVLVDPRGKVIATTAGSIRSNKGRFRKLISEQLEVSQ